MVALVEGQVGSHLLRVRQFSCSLFLLPHTPCTYFPSSMCQHSVPHSNNQPSNKYMIRMPQEPKADPSPNPSEIHRSILEWTNQTAPQCIYTSIKGDAHKNKKGYVWKCTVFSGAILPTPELRDRSDIYLDTSSKTIHIKVKCTEWTSWIPNSIKVCTMICDDYELKFTSFHCLLIVCYS